jgi:hypothetical protein
VATIAFVVVNDDIVELVNYQDVVLARLTLPDGNYVIYGKTVLINADSDDQNATARLVAVQGEGAQEQFQLDRADIRLAHVDSGRAGFYAAPPFEGGAQEVSLQATLQVPPELKSERVEFRASTFNGVARQTMLHAIQVDDIKYQPAGDNIA